MDMGKTIKLKESELINIIQKTVLNNSVISEVIKVEDFDEDYPDYHYTQIGVLPSKNNPNQIGIVFFNGPEFNNSDYFEPETPRMVYFLGPLGDFEFDSRMVHIKGGSPYVFGNDLKNVYYDKLLPLMTSNNAQPSSSDFTSDDIRESLEMAFPEYWEDETDDYSAGIRGIHTIGEKTDTDIDWSGTHHLQSRRCGVDVRGRLRLMAGDRVSAALAGKRQAPDGSRRPRPGRPRRRRRFTC